VDEARRRCVRQPAPFIGRVRRQAVCNEGNFSTLDTVEVYRLPMAPPNSAMPVERYVVLLTGWDPDDGVPCSLFTVRDQTMRAFWEQRLAASVGPSYLYAMPLYVHETTPTSFEYLVSRQAQEVQHSPRSPALADGEARWYNRYLPTRQVVAAHCRRRLLKQLQQQQAAQQAAQGATEGSGEPVSMLTRVQQQQRELLEQRQQAMLERQQAGNGQSPRFFRNSLELSVPDS
jgi:hypothetical protein